MTEGRDVLQDLMLRQDYEGTTVSGLTRIAVNRCLDRAVRRLQVVP